MALGSMPLVVFTMNVMFIYVILVFAKKPYKEHMVYRVKLALAGVGGVMIAANAGKSKSDHEDEPSLTRSFWGCPTVFFDSVRAALSRESGRSSFQASSSRPSFKSR